MSWQDKMKQLVEGTLNECSNYYFLEIHDNFNYTVFAGAEKIRTTKTSDDLSAHWIAHGTKLIHDIVDRVIKDNLQKLK